MSDHKKIAKNTLVLYIRIIVSTIIGLYTSRLVLQALGVDDYGVFNVVGGIIGLVAFISGTIGMSTQRFLNVGMAQNDQENLQKIFSTSVNVHILIALFVVIILETAGLWFLNNKLVIPEGQYSAANWVFQCSIAAFFLSIIYAPYNAALVANEKMTAFAVFSIINALIHLGFVILLYFSKGNHLILYAVLQLFESIIMRLLYGWYCKKILKECRYKFVLDRSLIKEMFGFSGWLIFGSVSDMLSKQGVNMLINIFFGPAYNASRAIAMNVYSTVAQFSNNFMTSVSPQIVKGYAKNEKKETYNLVFISSRLSFYLMMILGIPIFINSDLILKYWLGIVPPLSPLFVKLIVLEFTIRSIYTPLANINQAYGKIRVYQLFITVLFLLTFIFTYILFKLGFAVYTTFYISIILAIVGLFGRLIILKKQLSFPAGEYLKRVTLKTFLVMIVAFVPSFFFQKLCNDNLVGLLLSCLVDLIISILCVIGIGLNKYERIKIFQLITHKFIRNKLK